MITNVSLNTMSPSFGLAKLSDGGRKIAEDCGIISNDFLESDLFTKKGAIIGKIKTPEDFERICEKYGCSGSPIQNAEFIKMQILKGNGKPIKKDLAKKLKGKVGKKDAKSKADKMYSDTISTLYAYNYDNEMLRKKQTLKLLHQAESAMAPDVYAQHKIILTDAK